MASADRGSLWRSRWAAVGAAVAVSIGAGGVLVADATSPGASSFVAITPCRLADTRSSTGNIPIGPRTTPIGQGETVAFTVRGANGQCTGIPSDATGVSLNVTTVDGTANSFLTVWPSDNTRPTASTNNWTANQSATPNKVDVKLSADGRISAFNNQGTVNLILDVVGYYEPASSGSSLGYQVVTKAATVPQDSFLADSLSCPAGKKPTGGGVVWTSAANLGAARIVQSGLLGGNWAFDIENVNGGPAFNVQLQVICITAP